MDSAEIPFSMYIDQCYTIDTGIFLNVSPEGSLPEKTKDGEIYLHLLINLAREDFSVVGGHLAECRLSATCEMFVRRIEGTVERRHDEAVTGLNLYEFV